MQMGFYFNQQLCINCRTCIVACKDWHDLPAGPVSFIRMISIEKGTCPDVSVHHVFGSCYHCENPACTAVCPVDAVKKREEDGVVVVDGATCIGCKQCKMACPYQAPQFEFREEAKMQKCDFCIDRLSENKKPICVDACIMKALDAGPLDELQKKYGDCRQAEGFVCSEKVIPSIIFSPKKMAKDLPVRKVIVSPPHPTAKSVDAEK
ncbi:MAG: 4Fe-4S dicluster domain-containing protein [Desulfobacterales bacterium]